MTARRHLSILALILPLAAACASSSGVRTSPLERSWADDPGSRLRPPATIVFEEGGERRLIVCVEGGVYACPESGAGRVESIRSSSRPVAAIAPAGADQGFLVVEAATATDDFDRVVLTDLDSESQVLYEAQGRTLGVPVRVGTREAWLASTSHGGDERAVLVTADMQGRRAVQLQPADLDAVFHIARNPHTGRTLVSGVRRRGARAESGLFELRGGSRPRADLIDAEAWAPAWSGCGKHLAVARGTRSAKASRVRYGPLDDCVLRVTDGSGAAREIPIDGVILALCFDPADEDLLFAAIADADEIRDGALDSIRILRVRVARDGLQSAAIAGFDLTHPAVAGPEGYLTSN
jgi:hypothetical protein